ncbi:MAG: DNA repair and recombination protein RadA [Candidatus Atabeyarchaeum deiterrae]
MTDLPGVGPAIAKKLVEAGYRRVESIAVAAVQELSKIADIGANTAQKIIEEARKVLEIGFETAEEIFKRRKNVGRIITSSKNLDTLLGGGVETQSITEAYGEYRTGKTQIAHQLSVNIQLPVEKGGLEAGALYVDCEGTFRPERIYQMALGQKLDPTKVLKNIIIARAYNSDHQVLLVHQSEEFVEEKNIRLIVVDSIVGHFRAEYIGRERLAERQQKLNRHLHELQRLADIHGVAVFVTNQVMAKPDVFFGDPTQPVGGHVLAHVPQTRLYLRRSKGNIRICRLVDSSYLPEGEAVFVITEEGIKDQ